jgi:5-formyltetrahydrofolate cyclo-ligase
MAQPNPDKRALRAQLRGIRAAVPDALRRAAGRELARHALHKRLLRRNLRAGFYIPAKGEIDVVPLLHRALRMGVDCYLPVVPGRGRKKLWFTRITAGPASRTTRRRRSNGLRRTHPAWHLNRYGIPEYHHPSRKRHRADRLDLVFMPLLGFDPRGFRVGMGGGFYDASLAFLNRRRLWRRPRLIGVAFAVQQVEQVPEDPWDVPLNAVLTERGCVASRFGGNP